MNIRGKKERWVGVGAGGGSSDRSRVEETKKTERTNERETDKENTSIQFNFTL